MRGEEGHEDAFKFDKIVIAGFRQDPLLKLLGFFWVGIFTAISFGIMAVNSYLGFRYAEEFVKKPPLFLGKAFAKNVAGEPGAVYALSATFQLLAGPIIALLRWRLQKQQSQATPIQDVESLITPHLFSAPKRDTYWKKGGFLLSSFFSFIFYNFLLPLLPTLIQAATADAEIMNFNASQTYKNRVSLACSLAVALSIVPYIAYLNYEKWRRRSISLSHAVMSA